MKHFLSLIIISALLIQCKQSEKKTSTEKLTSKSNVRHAKGFDIIVENNQKKLVLKKVFQSSNKQFTYLLTNKTDLNKNELKVPVEKLVVTGTAHIPMLELLNSENKLVGFPNTKYISSKKTRKRIKENKIVELGSKQDINTEKLMDLQPELVVGFSLHSNNKVYKNIQKSGIPVLFNGAWLEETPLGRAEWIKFFGVLLNKEKEADSIFNNIEKKYLEAKKLVQKSNNSPTVISGSMFKDIWNVPAGKSFMATFFKDANLNYFWKNTKGTGSLQLNFESVLDVGKNADYWLKCGMYATIEQLIKANKHYKEFNTLQKENVYTIASKKGETGGLIYYELSPVRPDLVLKDLIKITNPTLFPDYELFFFEKLN